MKRMFLVPPIYVVLLLAAYFAPLAFILTAAIILHQGPLAKLLIAVSFHLSELLAYFHPMQNAFVIGAAIIYGIFRVAAFHPLRNQQYLAWLRSTPWTPDALLPLGPLNLVWQDALILLLLTAMVSWTHPFNLIAPSALYLLTFSIALLLAGLQIESPQNAIPWEPYISALIFPLLAIFWQFSWVWYAVPIAIYFLEQRHLQKTLYLLPWIPKAQAHQPDVDWPWNKVGPGKIAKPIKWPRMVRACILIALWLFALLYTFAAAAEQPFEKDDLLAMLAAAGLIFAASRLIIYVAFRHWPIGFFGRLFAGRFILPRYDIVFFGPLCCLFCAGVFILLMNSTAKFADTPHLAVFSLGIASILLVAFKSPPTLRHWILTGGYRMAPPNRRQRVNASQIRRKPPLILRNIGG